MSRTVRPLAAAALITLAAAAILWLMGRPPICTCGDIDLWVNSASSARTSQMLADWYSLSHVIHGILFYGLLALVMRRYKPEQRLAVAVLIEAAWELVENSPVIIDRYRKATVAIGYTGDSILNSVSDIAMMALGFELARRLPVRGSVALVLILELLALAVIRDNLALNVWMLLAPSDAVRGWQAG